MGHRNHCNNVQFFYWQIETAPLSSMTPARPGISDYFTKQVVADVTDSTKKKQLTLQKM